MLKIAGLSKSFGAHKVLDDISFEIHEGEKVSLLGPGSCGKSTIIKMILGLMPPDTGTIELLGLDMVGAAEKEREQILKSVGVAFQQGALFDSMTVEDNLRFAMENMTNFDERKMDQKVSFLLSSVKLPRVRNMFSHELSGGMQRRVAVARALATEPKIAIFDEPTAGLDPVTSTVIINMINELVDLSQGYAMMVVTSTVEVAIRFAERIILVHEGRVVGDGSWKTLLMEGDPWVQHFLGIRLKGIDIDYAQELGLPTAFITQHF